MKKVNIWKLVGYHKIDNLPTLFFKNFFLLEFICINMVMGGFINAVLRGIVRVRQMFFNIFCTSFPYVLHKEEVNSIDCFG